MALQDFQRALCDLIGSPELCTRLRRASASQVTARAGVSSVLGDYDLSPRERERLLDIVWQRGMSTNCTLYRSNRVTPIYTLLHQTCVVLGARLKATVDAYWAETALSDLEFKREIDRFGAFLKQQLANGVLTDPLLEEVLDLELAMSALRFAPRRKILAHLSTASSGSHDRLYRHPLVRVVHFRHDPAEVLGALARGEGPRGLPARESYLLLSMIDESLAVTELPARAGRLLWQFPSSGLPRNAVELEAVATSALCSVDAKQP
jgi:hypothetical protein